MTPAGMTPADRAAIVDPDTFVTGVPYDLLATLRRTAPICRVAEPAQPDGSTGPGFWAVFRHADVRAVLRQPALFSSYAGATQVRDPATPADLAYVRQMMLNMDPPDHSRLRRLLAKAFTPRAVTAVEDRITARADELVRAVADDGAGDFAQIAAELPLLTLADVLGVPESDRGLLFDWSNRVIGWQDAEYSVSAAFEGSNATPMAWTALTQRPAPGADGRLPDPRTHDGMLDLYAYAHELARYKRAHPGDDVMSVLLAQVDDVDGRVSLTEFENMFWLFAVAGNETLRNGIPGGMVALLQKPAEYARLRADRSLLATAVEEMLRWWTPVVHFRRTATQDIRLCPMDGQTGQSDVDSEGDGVDIAAGDKVVVFFASANRDERVFARPDRFDVGRTGGEHLTFGHGPHFCLGAHLARAQMRSMFAAVLDRLGEVEQAGEIVRLRSAFQNGVKHLPIRWRPGGAT